MTAPPATVLPAAPRIAERTRASRRARWGRLLRRTGLGLLVVVPAAVLVWVVLTSSWLAVDRVRVQGTGLLTGDQVTAAADVRLGVPLATLDTGGVARRVRALDAVASVSVSRDWPGTLRVRVVERRPVAVAADAGGGWSLVDEGGARFLPGEAPRPGLPRLDLAPAAEPASVAAVLAVLADLPPELVAQVASAGAGSPASVTLRLTDGRTVVWGAPGQAELKAPVVLALLRQPGSTFDVTSPDVAVVR